MSTEKFVNPHAGNNHQKQHKPTGKRGQDKFSKFHTHSLVTIFIVCIICPKSLNVKPFYLLFLGFFVV